MLRITSKTNHEDAKRYFTIADYYSEGQEVEGLWRGEGARRLGLEGTIRQADWDALCDNRHPITHDQLTARHDRRRIVGYDFNFHVPKSVSLLHAMTKDERIVEAFRSAVHQTMREIEAEMQTRVRKGGRDENRATGNMAWGEWIHTTSRPVNGTPDPLLHAHCFCFNATFDPAEKEWKAGQFRELKRDAPYFQAVFHSRMARGMVELGLPVDRTKAGWELRGIDRAFIEKFSRRSKQIDETAREMGIVDPDRKAGIGAMTREGKQKHLSYAQLQETWREKMSPSEKAAIDWLKGRIGSGSDGANPREAARGLEFAIGHEFERKSVIPERTLLASAMRHSVGAATVEQVLDKYRRSDLIHGTRDGRKMVTSRDVLAEESKIIDFARMGRGTRRAYASEWNDFQNKDLTLNQQAAVRHILTSHDNVMIVRGGAGVGKTALLQEARAAIEKQGGKVYAFAPSTSASHVSLRREGFKDADTVARLLVDNRLQQHVQGGLWIIDEAGLISNKTMLQLLELSAKLHSRLLLVGDPHQHGAVERGSVLQMLQREAGIEPVQVKEIKRQKGEYKQAVRAISEGRMLDGFRKFDEMGWIKEIASEDRYRQMASDYVEALTKGSEALVVSPTHSEKNFITSAIRRELKERGELGQKDRTFNILTNANLTEAERGDPVHYERGDVLVFHQNAKGFKRGERLIVGDSPLPLSQAERFQVFHRSTIDLSTGDVIRMTRNGMTLTGEHRLINGATYRVKGFDKPGNIILENGWTIDQDWGHFDHGYVVTSHASQGRTIKGDVFIGQSSESFGASSREQFYVSVSRAARRVTIYTDDKVDLLDAVSRSEDRLTATEFINGATSPPDINYLQAAEHHREKEREPELAYER